MILHTVTTGTGEPIIIIHQGLQTSETDFQEQREFFSRNYQVIQVDLRGHGKSVTDAADDFTEYFEKSAKDLNETLESLQVESAHIIGSSLGSLAGLVFAKRFPRRVKSIILSGIIPQKPDNWDEMNAEQATMIEETMKHKEAIEYFSQIHNGDWAGLLKFAQLTDWYPFEETADLSQLPMPVLYLVGEENPWEVIGVVDYPKQNDGIRVAIIPFSGHLVHLQQPEIYNKIVDNFLTQFYKKD